jgi:CO/xanthine dehydrogenase Mo-binding subunit
MMQGAVVDGIANALYKSTGKRFYNQPFSAEFQKKNLTEFMHIVVL